jgi:ATP-dependent Clp protease protease subunit
MPPEAPEAQPKGALPNVLSRKLFDSRSVLIYGEITSALARSVSGQLLAMATDSDGDITCYVHSQGGHVEAGDTIHDMIAFVKPRVRMIGTGWVASAGAHIYLAVPKVDRFCLPNTRFLLHQPMGGSMGRASDLEIEAAEILRMRGRLNRVIAERTGQPLKKVEKDTERNFWMTAEEAVDYGLVNQVINSAAELG